MTLKGRYRIHDIGVIVLLAVSAILLLSAINLTGSPGDTASASRRVERKVEKRMSMLDVLIDKAVRSDHGRTLDAIPEDMVVYRYMNDTLVSWYNQFTVSNDDITSRYLFQTLNNPHAEVVSPLAYASEEVSLINMGPKWYLVKTRTKDEVKVIGGLMVMNEMDRSSYNGVNRHFKLGNKFSIRPLTYSGGSAVSFRGKPQFKILYDSMQGQVTTNSFLVWISLVIFVIAVLLFLSNNRSLWRYLISVSAIFLAMAGVYLWGFRLRNDATLFSPALYADGGFLFSIGALIVVNNFIILLVLCTYMVRNVALRDILLRAKDPKLMLGLIDVLDMAAIVAILLYAISTIRSITLNSGICLELNKINDLARYTAVVYLAEFGLLMTIPLLLQMLRPGFKAWTGIRFDAFSVTSRCIMALIAGVGMTTVTCVVGLRKEEDRQSVWANRLSVERDLGLEMQLRGAEIPISQDMLIGALASIRKGANAVLNRIAENYLTRITQDYDISVFVAGDKASLEDLAFIQSRIQDAEPIFPNSHFVYRTSHSARTSYTGYFSYLTNVGVSHVLVEVEAKANRADKGYAALLGVSSLGKVTLPPNYSYAKYSGTELATSRGRYAYSTTLDEDHLRLLGDHSVTRITEGSYVHFINRVSDVETIIISRPKVESTYYLVAALLLTILAFCLLSLLRVMCRHRDRRLNSSSGYYKSRVSIVLVVSLVFTLVVMAAVSVLFVYRRNDVNQRTMMTDRVNSIRAILESECEKAVSLKDLDSPEFSALVDETSNTMTTDISLYTTEGKVFYSTTPEIFDRALLGSRLDQNAFQAILSQNKRYFIQKETIGDTKYFSLYAPIYNSAGEMLCIMKSPFTDENFDFELDAVYHFATMFVVFIFLLIIARFLILRVVNRLFKPLEEMSTKMAATDVDSLQYIEYSNDDEISSLVTSYNRMVSDLSESTRQLAQAERDKAWSGMARQVAHEIKNPLTPMKLQLQRIIRLKEKGAPGWEDKFDEVVKVVLDHIDVLTDTANEFSTFAKLYSEDHVRIDVDRLLQEEIDMFDAREGISFQYFGLDGASIMGPKPQLTRVFVNLLTNSVQALTLRAQEAEENGETVPQGIVTVSLRNSTEEGYYDIVFEDNGPGVSEENKDKLFTPNFTTKSGGTGLGLAICRSILEKCDATIQYSRSFSLGGACFSIHYPKNKS